SPLTSIVTHDDQGCGSSTSIVIYADGTKVVIQLRDSPVDTALIALARGRLGDIVPLVRTVQETQTHHAYGMPYIDGYRWSPLILTSLEDDIGVTQQLGEILTKLKLDLPNDDVVINHIIPRLENVLENGMPDVEDAVILRSRIENLLSRAHNLEKLPLTFCHIDINPFNVR
ncbi:hypothetical protein C8J55DRAFT_379031, partial [Lentinula edodes]